jgi:hypothetical protein
VSCTQTIIYNLVTEFVARGFRLAFDAAITKLEKAKNSKKEKEKKEAEDEYEIAKSR